MPRKQIHAQSQQHKYQNKMWNMFKNKKERKHNERRLGCLYCQI